MGAVEQLGIVLRLIRNTTLATYALVLYEFLVMLDREYEAIYKSRWSLSKCLYLVCRFGLLLCWPIIMYAFMFDHDVESCKPFLLIVSILFMLFACLPQCLYVLRAYAITGAKRWSLLIYLPCLFAYLFVILWYSLSGMSLRKEVFLMSGRSGCFPDRSTTFFRMLFSGIALDGVVGLMLVIHFIRLPGPQTGLGNLLITQGMLYFPVMFLLYVGSAVVSAVGFVFTIFRAYQPLVMCTIITIPNIMACRFIIQIREYASNNPNSPEMLSKVRREVERAFPTGPLVIVQGTESSALSNNKLESKA